MREYNVVLLKDFLISDDSTHTTHTSEHTQWYLTHYTGMGCLQ